MAPSRWKQEVALRRGNIPEEISPAVRYLRVKTLVAGDGECGNLREKERGREEGRSERGREGRMGRSRSSCGNAGRGGPALRPIL